MLVAVVPDDAGYGMGEAEGHTRLLARSPTMLCLPREALDLFAAEFEADEDVPGADLVDRFAEWRNRALAELADPSPSLTSCSTVWPGREQTVRSGGGDVGNQTSAGQ